MCGRAASVLNHAAVAAAAGISESRWRDKEDYRERFNAGPGSALVVIRPASDREGDAAAAPDELAKTRILQTMRWGLVRNWTPADARPDFFRAFNGRSDTLTEKPMFSSLLARKRCVVMLSAYYEWRTEGSSPAVKQPYCVKPEQGDVLFVAALYDRWVSTEGELYSFSMLTKDASRLRWLHDREPVLLTKEEADVWLDVSNTDMSAERLLQRVSAPEAGVPLTSHPVSPRMSKGDVDDPACMTPAKREVERDAGNLASLFAKAQGTTPKRKAPEDETAEKPAAKARPTAENASPHREAKDKRASSTGQRSLASFFVQK